MKKAISWKLDESVIDMINELAKKLNWSKTAVIETAVKEFYDKNKENKQDKELEKPKIKIGDKYFNVKMLTSVEIGEMNDPAIAIDKIFADEHIKYKEFEYQKGDLIYDGDSKDEKYSNINKTIMVYQNYDDIPD